MTGESRGTGSSGGRRCLPAGAQEIREFVGEIACQDTASSVLDVVWATRSRSRMRQRGNGNALGEILPQGAVGVLVGTTLPWAVVVGEVHGESRVRRHRQAAKSLPLTR